MDDVNQRVEATFSPSYVERLAAEWILLVRSPITLLCLAAFPAAGVWLATLLLGHRGAAPDGAWLAVLLAFGFSPSVFFLNTYRAHRANLAQGAVTYRFDCEGVHVSTRLARSSLHWPAILRVRSSRSLILFHVTKRCAHFVPMRALSDTGAIDVVQQLAKAGGVPKVDN